MRILGISSNYHDASAAIVIDGKVVASAAEERFTYEKHDPSFPVHSVKYCLTEAKINQNDLDWVIYYEDPQTKFTRTLASAFKKFPFSPTAFIKSAKELISVGFWIKDEISKNLDISPEKIIYVPHHMSHAAHAFFTSPYNEAAIMTIDAVGEWSTACIFKASNENGIFNIEPVDVIPFPHSLGLVYSAFTGFLGFKVNDSECSTMALSAFGKPTYEQEVRKLLIQKTDGTFEVDMSYFDFSSEDKLPLTDKFYKLFGKGREPKAKIEFHSFEHVEVKNEDQIRFANIAASVQKVTEEVIVNYAKRAKKLTGMNNLCYAGGVALNCVANSKLQEANIFEDIYIPPEPGDGGTAMGAALYGSLIKDPKNVKPQKINPYLGKSYNVDSNFKKMIEEIDPEEWHKFSILNIKKLKKEDLEIIEFSSEDELIEYVSSEIENRKIVGWVQGRFENGPRALGNRSILCRPDCIETARRLSKEVKLRASFRPYACSILENYSGEYLELSNKSSLKYWMQATYKIKSDKIDALKTTAHVDGTTRAQVVNALENSCFEKLISACHRKTGVPALLNTSFNLSGFPLVSGPYDALLVFAKTNMDVVVINNIVLKKKWV